MSDLEYPEDLRYTSEHEWVRTGQEGVVRIGITSYAQDALGDVVYVSLPAVGDELAVGDTCGEIESTKSVSDLYSPLAGEVTGVSFVGLGCGAGSGADWGAGDAGRSSPRRIRSASALMRGSGATPSSAA